MATAGCGPPEFPKTYPLSGTVLLPNGKPLQGGKIEFESVVDPDLRAFGEIEKDGTFARVYTYKPNGREVQGVIAGEHRVRIELPDGDADEGGGRDPGEDGGGAVSRRKPPLIDPRYRGFDTSGLKIAVPAPENRVTIRLEKSGR
jgi:hypothetical protein